MVFGIYHQEGRFEGAPGGGVPSTQKGFAFQPISAIKASMRLPYFT
jgi:hypothetical protein